MSRPVLLLCQLMVAVVGLAMWQLLATVPIFGRVLLPPFFFSNPVDVGSQIVDWFVRGVIWKHLLITLWESVLAFTIGSVAGVRPHPAAAVLLLQPLGCRQPDC